MLVTNAHVLSRRPADLVAGAVHPDEAVITFAALRAADPTIEMRIAEVLFESPPEALDVVVVRLTTPVAPLEAIPVARCCRRREAAHRSASSATPQGRGLFLYRGNSWATPHPASTTGRRRKAAARSPVFNADWKLVGLHHAGGEALPKLNGEPGTYEANEGISIGAIAHTAVAAARDTGLTQARIASANASACSCA